MTRSVYRGILDLAVRHDAIPLNPVRSVGSLSSKADARVTVKDARRSFTRAERDAVIAYADTNLKAANRDLGDLIAFLGGTGARIGEACALRWSALDLKAGTADLGPTVVRIKGRGLIIQEKGKTTMSQRTVRLPTWLVVRLMEGQLRAESNHLDVVFASPLGLLRDPSNTSHHIRDVLNETGHPWASAHTFRKTVATLLDEAGVSARESANQFGHAKASMTMDVYMNRRTINERAAEVL
jgi:integrase